MSICEYAKKFLLIPYVWGGSHPAYGLDCSGFVQEVLAYADMDPPGDQTAQGLFRHFASMGSQISPTPGQGALVFYGKSVNEITHVAFMLDENKIIEAAGGGSQNTSRELAIKYGGFVRIRAMSRRKDVVAVLMPKYPEWVLNEFRQVCKGA